MPQIGAFQVKTKNTLVEQSTSDVNLALKVLPLTVDVMIELRDMLYFYNTCTSKHCTCWY